MRYSEDFPTERLAAHANDDMLLFTAFISVFIGITLVWMGRKGKIMWLWVWGSGLIVVSLYLGYSVSQTT